MKPSGSVDMQGISGPVRWQDATRHDDRAEMVRH
jgi:hypothetical protein